MQRILAAFALATLLMVGAGCDAQLDMISPPLSPELAYVREHADNFAAAGEPAAQDMPPGSVIDDLADLNGCWGTVWTLQTEDGRRYAVYVVIRFDPATSTYERQLEQVVELSADYDAGMIGPLVDLVDGVFELAIRESGRYEGVLFDDGRAGLSFTASEVLFWNPLSGQWEPGRAESTPFARISYAVRDGDRLVEWLFVPAGEPDIPAEVRPLVFVRFDCP